MTRPGARSGARDRLLAVALGTGIVVVLLLLLEGALRLVDPDLRVRRDTAFPEIVDHLRNLHHEPDAELLWRATPGYASGQLRISDDGFREAPDAADPSRYDVVCLGNSVTFGYTTPRHADTYPALLESHLRARCALELEVLNAGVIGYSSAQGRALVEAEIEDLGASVVTILYGYNDHHLSPMNDGETLRQVRGAGVRLALQRLYIPRAARKLAAALRPPEVTGELVPRVTPDELDANLTAIVVRVRDAGAAPVLVTVPLRPGVPLVENPVRVRSPDGTSRWAFQARWLTSKLPPDARGPLTRLLFASEPMDPKLLLALRPTLERLASEAPDTWPLPRYVLALAANAAGDASTATERFREAAERDLERRVLWEYNDVIRHVAARENVPLVDVERALAEAPDAFSDVVHTNAIGNARIAELLAEAVATALGCMPEAQ